MFSARPQKRRIRKTHDSTETLQETQDSNQKEDDNPRGQKGIPTEVHAATPKEGEQVKTDFVVDVRSLGKNSAKKWAVRAQKHILANRVSTYKNGKWDDELEKGNQAAT